MDGEFLNACRVRATTDPDEVVREKALQSFGDAMESTQDSEASRFLADLVMDSASSRRVRMAAYWALRKVQFGFTEEDTIRLGISLMKEFQASAKQRGISQEQLDAMGIGEGQVKSKLLCGGRWPNSMWDTPEEINLEFVEQFASREHNE